MKMKNLKVRAHEQEELSHYSQATSDFEYLFPIGWSELEGVAHRGNFDLTQHAKHSGKQLSYFDEERGRAHRPARRGAGARGGAGDAGVHHRRV